MRNFNMNAIKDFWEDYVNSFVDTKVNLRNAKICRIDRMIGENLIILATDVDTGLQYEQKMHVLPAKLTKRLERIGCFYEIDNYRYIPTVDVKGRVINDYCKPLKSEDDTKSTIVLSRFSEDEDVARLARRMKNARNLTFVSRRPFEVMDSYVTYKYTSLVGIKSANKQTQIYAIDIMDAFCKKAEKTKAFSGYIDQQKANNVNFTFTCNIDNSSLALKVSDSITGRKSIQIDIISKINGRTYTLESIEINHRNTKSAECIADTLFQKVSRYLQNPANTEASPEDVEKVCLKYIPQKARTEFTKEIRKEGVNAVEAAYDMISSGLIFNLKGKVHKTKEYDAGKRKAEIALGQMMAAR